MDTTIRGIGFTENRVIPVETDLTKENVAVGTEVWTLENANTFSREEILPAKISSNQKQVFHIKV